MVQMTIGGLAHNIGASLCLIRYYDDSGLLSFAHAENGYQICRGVTLQNALVEKVLHCAETTGLLGARGS